MRHSTHDILQRIEKEVEFLSAPQVLRESIARHQQCLLSLAESLLCAGMEQADIDARITQMLDTYKAELLRTIHELRLSDGGAP